MDAEAVVDSSVWAAVWLHEPGHEQWAAGLSSLRRVRSAPFFRFEVANVLWKRRSCSTPAERAASVQALFSLPVTEDFEVEDGRAALDLACSTGKTFYDMAFVALARRHGVALWTLDAQQASAARDAGVRCVTAPTH